jgi:hypothetical protein
MLKTFLGLAVLLLVAAAIDAAPQPTITTANDVHAGAVMAVTQDTLMLMDERDNEMETFVVTPATKITFRGEPGALHDIQMGDRATITAHVVKDELIALTIDAMRVK